MNNLFPEQDINTLVTHLNEKTISNNRLADACYNILGYCVSVTDVSGPICTTHDVGVMEDNEIAGHLKAFNRDRLGLPPWLTSLTLSILKDLLQNKHYMVFI